MIFGEIRDMYMPKAFQSIPALYKQYQQNKQQERN